MVFPQHQLIFVAIPKTATTSLASLLHTENCGSDHLSIFHIYDNFDHRVLDTYKVITCVRNPYDRFISAYEHMKRNDNLGGDFSILEKIEDLKVRIANNPRKDGWDEHVDDLVWVPQSYWVSIRGNVIADHIFKFETLSEDIPKFFESYPTVDLSRFEPANVGGYDKYELSNDEKSAVYEMYKQDFELFGYSK